MTQSSGNARKTFREVMQGRRARYAVAGLLAVSAGAFSIAKTYARVDGDPTSALGEAAAAKHKSDSLAAERAARARIGADGVVPVAKPEHVRALYLNAWAAGSPRKLLKLIDVANQTEINSFVIDIKEGGEVSYTSKVKLAQDAGAVKVYIRDIRSVLTKLKDNNIYPIARIVVFKDPVLAAARPEFAVKNRDSTLWRDNKGNAWVDSFNKKVWDYNIALAREAVELGFSEVQWDYVRISGCAAQLSRSWSLARAERPHQVCGHP